MSNFDRTDAVQVSGRAALADAIEHARCFARDAGLAERPAARLAILIEELVANVLDHGGIGEDDPIALEFTRRGGEVVIRMSDGGIPFDPRESEGLEPDLERIGGIGLPFIHAWAELLSYERIDGRNQTTLRLRGER